MNIIISMVNKTTNTCAFVSNVFNLPVLLGSAVVATTLSGCMGTWLDKPSHTAAPAAETTRLAAPHDEPPIGEYPTQTITQQPAAAPPAPTAKETAIYPGTGRFINSDAAAHTPRATLQDGDLVLNFQDTDIREVTKVVLGDMLNANYLIDADVKGTVSLQTSRPVSSDALLPLYEKMLWMSDAVLLEEDGLYRIAARAKATRGTSSPRLADSHRKLRPGYQTYVVPLRYVAVDEMKKILEPFLTEGAILSVDERRNLLMLAGTSQELQSWLETVEIFDVDWMTGNSVGLFELDYVEPARIVEELRQVLGLQTDGQTPSLISLEPIDRLNAILAITPQPRYLEMVRTWVDRLDHAEGGPGTRLYVYRVKNRKATDLAEVLNTMFESTDIGGTSPVRLAPGATPVTMKSPQSSSGLPTLGSPGNERTYASKERLATQPGGDVENDLSADTGVLLTESASVRLIADELNNSIVIMATAAEYKIVEAALQRMDIVPLQVLIEASIVEVTLTDDLRYGVEWFFKNNNIQGDKTGIGTLDLGAAGIAAKVPGFSYALVDTLGDVRAVLNLLAEKSDLNVLSSPSLTVLDNRTAEIRVGNQVPVRTETAVTEGGVTVESIQFKDTGVLLSVTPGVNTGGLVTMDVKQEVTDVGSIDAATGQRTFLQRNIQSVVAVQSGHTIVLGGLILENESNAESGVPGLYRIPVLGKLFGQTERTSDRTELLVLITPRVIKNQDDANGITDEFRIRMKNIEKWPFDKAQQSESGLTAPQKASIAGKP